MSLQLFYWDPASQAVKQANGSNKSKADLVRSIYPDFDVTTLGSPVEGQVAKGVAYARTMAEAKAMMGMERSASKAKGVETKKSSVDDDDPSEDGGSSAEWATVGTIIGYTLANSGITVPSVVEDANVHYRQNRSNTNHALLMWCALAAAGNVKREFGAACNVAFSKMSVVPASFAGENGGNFKGFTILGYILHEIIADRATDGTLHANLLKVHSNFKRFVSTGRISTFSASDTKDPKAQRRELIYAGAQKLFQGAPGWKTMFMDEHLTVLNASAAKAKATSTTVMKPIGQYSRTAATQ